MKICFLFILSALLNAAVSNPNEKIKTALTDRIKKEFPLASKISVDSVYVSQRIPDGAELEELRPLPPIGSISFGYSWEALEGRKKAFGSAISRVFLKVAVSKTPLRHGDMFSEENTAFEERELTPYSHTGYFMENAELFTLSAQGNIPPNHVIVTSQTSSPLLIRAGQMVDLVYETSSLKITARSKALKSGRAGDRIRVENVTSKKVVEGRVVSGNEVSIR